MNTMRSAQISRKTSETDIIIDLNIDGGEVCISSGIGFFDHMLTAFAVHAGFGLKVSCNGDLNVDCHHTVEDIGIVLGQAFAKCADKNKIARFGSFYVPMDEALAFVSLDVSNRPFLVFSADFPQETCGGFDCCMCEEFWRAFAVNAGITLHIKVEYGSNSHHMIEAIFKAVGHALEIAVKEKDKVLSTKGTL